MYKGMKRCPCIVILVFDWSWSKELAGGGCHSHFLISLPIVPSPPPPPPPLLPLTNSLSHSTVKQLNITTAFPSQSLYTYTHKGPRMSGEDKVNYPQYSPGTFH